MLRACGRRCGDGEPGRLPAVSPGHPLRISGEYFLARSRRRLIEVEPDLSNAVPFLAAALATGGSVTVRDWPGRTTQPAGRIIGGLQAMGATCTLTPEGLRVRGAGPDRRHRRGP